jgi:hypothetical protein
MKMGGKKTLRLLATDLVILDGNGIAHTDEMIHRAGMALQESATFRALVLGEREAKTPRPGQAQK